MLSMKKFIAAFLLVLLTTELGWAREKDPLMKGRWFAEALATHNKSGLRNGLRHRFGNEAALKAAGSIADSMNIHRGSLGQNDELKSYVSNNSGWLIGQIRFSESTFFYEIRTVDGELYGFQGLTAPFPEEAPLMSDLFKEVDRNSALVEKQFSSGQTALEFFEKLYKKSNHKKALEVPEENRQLVLTSIDQVAAFEVTDTYTRYLYVVGTKGGLILDCRVDIYLTRSGGEIVNSYSCDRA